MSETRGTCGVCGREFKATGGRLSRHGYQMVGGRRGTGYAGWQSGSCHGSGRKRLEDSIETLLVAAALVAARLAGARALLARYGVDVEASLQDIYEHGRATWDATPYPGLADAGAEATGYYWQSTETKQLRKDICDALHDVRELPRAFDRAARAIETRVYGGNNVNVS